MRKAAKKAWNSARLAPLRAMRPHQWAKNLLIFVPMITSYFFNGTVFLKASVGFFSFCLAASAGYLINDVIDAPVDRKNPAKKHRPVASGQFSPGSALLLAALALAGGVAASFLLGETTFTALLLLYLFLSLGYSAFLKRFLFVDVVTLTTLYTLRIYAGAAAIGVELSAWLAAFSLTTFLSLALLKRYVEIHDHVQVSDEPTGPHGRPYDSDALKPVGCIGAFFGYSSIAVLAFYLTSPAVTRLYHRQSLLWSLCALLFWWVTRMWRLAMRGRMHQDPVAFAVKDYASWLVAALAIAVLFLARLGGGTP